ncbi:MAG: TSUP family transporter [Oscillospiraceae bacterium]|nr:TSUP family transporter [Oscillospiraceae bacterium]
MLPFFIVCPLVFLAGFVDSIAGGGGLISLPAYMLAGVPTHTAIATNKLSSAVGTVVSTGRFLKNGYVPVKLSLCAAVMALIGSAIGAHISMLMPEKVLQGMLLAVLPVVAFYVLRNKDMGENEKTGTRTKGQLLVIAMGAALVIGLYDGIYGPGTGTFLLLILTGLGRMDLRSASGTTKVINLSSNVAALVTFILGGQVYWKLGLAASLFSIAGHYTGSGMVTKNGRKIVRPVVLTVLVILFVKILLGF